MPRLASGTASWREVQELCTWYRQRGVCSLLLSGTVRDFYLNMMQSAAAFAFPWRLRQRAKDHQPSQALLRRAVRRLPECRAADRRPQPDDLERRHGVRRGFSLCPVPHDAGARSARLGRRRAAGAHGGGRAGTERSRMDACQALLERRADDFNEALLASLSTRVDLVESMVKRGALSNELAAWLRHFASEGFALVRIGNRSACRSTAITCTRPPRCAHPLAVSLRHRRMAAGRVCA